MDTPQKRELHDHSYSATSPVITPPTEDKEMAQHKNFSIPIFPVINWLTILLSYQAEIIQNCIVTIVSPLFSSFASESYPQIEETERNVESDLTQHGETNIISLLVKKVGLGLLSAAYVCMVLVFVMIVAMFLGVGLVRMFVEEPVFVKEELNFDYSAYNPTALFLPRGGGDDGGGFVPVGHTFYVSLVLLMPESDYNRDVGVFQLTAELIDENGGVTATSSHPYMMRFRSWPVRTFHTFFMGIPLLLGITSETQRLSIPLLKHKESLPRTEAIRLSIIPRAGTLYLPQIYEAEILVNSQLPWKKELVRRWKWTFYVWTSFYIYVLLLILLFLFFKPLSFPGITSITNSYRQQEAGGGMVVQTRERGIENREASERWRRWNQRRNKRKAMIFESSVPQPESSASSITFTSPSLNDDVGDSESVCFGGR